MSQALARAFNQWNQMLIDQQQWDVAREERNQDFSIKSVLMEEEAKDRAMQRENLKLSMQAQRQQNELQQQQVNQLRDFQRPQEISLTQFANDAMQSAEGREKIANLFGEHGEDVTISQADGMLMSGGNRVPIAPSEIAGKLSVLDLINRAYVNMPDKVLKEQMKAEDQVAQAQKDVSFWKKQPESRFYPRAAQAKQQLNAANKRLDQVNQALEPRAQAAFYGREAGDFEAAAGYFRKFGKAAADQIEFFENQGEKFRKNEQIWLAKLSDGKQTKPKTFYRIHNDVDDPENYGRVHSQVTVYPSTDVDKLIPNDGTMVLSETPRFPTIDDGTGEGGGGKKKLPPAMSYDQLDGNIHARYQMAINSMEDVTSPAVFEKRETHKKISKAIALAQPRDAQDRFEAADHYGEVLVDGMENMYHQTIDPIRDFQKEDKRGERLFLMKLNDEHVNAKAGKPHNKFYAGYVEDIQAAVKAGQQVGPSTQGFVDWYTNEWKKMYLDQLDDVVGQDNHVITEANIYVPDKFTRDMRKLMQGMEID